MFTIVKFGSNQIEIKQRPKELPNLKFGITIVPDKRGKALCNEGQLESLAGCVIILKGVTDRNGNSNIVIKVDDLVREEMKKTSTNDCIELDDGGCICFPDSDDGTIRRKDKDGNTEEVRKFKDDTYDEWYQLFLDVWTKAIEEAEKLLKENELDIYKRAVFGNILEDIKAQKRKLELKRKKLK